MSSGVRVARSRPSPGSTRRFRRGAAILVAALLLTACTASGQATPVPVAGRPGSMGAGVTLAALGAAPKTTCPLTTLPAAVQKAGLAADGTVRGSVDALAAEVRVTGIAVDCTVDISGGGSVSLLLIAGQNGSAIAVLAPQLQSDAQLSVTSLRTVLGAAAGQQPGDQVAIPGTAPAAIRIVTVDGATTAAVLVTGSKGPTRSQIETVAGALAHS